MKVDPKHAAAREIDGLVFALRTDGASLAEISRELGVSPVRIRQREIRVWLRLLRAAKAAQPRLERLARAKSGESGRSTSAPARALSTGPIAENDAERPDPLKAGRSKCIRIDCPLLAAEHYAGYCVAHGYDERKICRSQGCGRAPAPGSKLCLKHEEERQRWEVFDVLKQWPF